MDCRGPFVFIVHRDLAGKVTGALLKQPPAQGDLEVKCETASFVPPMGVDALMEKVIEAQGGEANLKRHKSITLKELTLVNLQGLKVELTEYARLPNAEASQQTMYAGKKKIGSIRSFFDGAEGGSESTFSPATTLHGESLVHAKISSTMYPELNWKSLFKSVAITGKDKVGDEEVYVVEMKPEKGHSLTDYVSVKTFRVLRRKAGAAAQAETYDAELLTAF